MKTIIFDKSTTVSTVVNNYEILINNVEQELTKRDMQLARRIKSLAKKSWCYRNKRRK
jgi:hypothetical protein